MIHFSQVTSRRARFLLGSALILPLSMSGQAVHQAITLDHGGAPQSPGYQLAKGEYSFANAPANFYAFSPAHIGEPASLEAVTLRFSEATTLTKIESTNGDFAIESGGSCREGSSYGKGDSCSVLVRFTPQGAGRRLGHLSVGQASSAEPAAFGLGGYSYVPALQFIPAVTTTIPATYAAPNGVLKSAENLTVDGGDTLYIADTANGLVRYMDSGGKLTTLASGYSSPNGIAVDNFGEVYFDETAANIMYEIYDYGPVVPASGTTVSSCTTSAPCTLDTTQINLPGEMSTDPYNHLFFVEETNGAAISTVQPEPANLIFLYDPFPFQDSPSTAMAVDANDNLYTLWSTSGNCEIQQQSLYNAENSDVSFTKIAGGRICGYSGDGGQANNAEIGAVIGQIAFDAAGDLYFTDTNNQRVRRINVNTGIITTVLGSGTKGFIDAGTTRSTYLTLSNPTGLAVDSQGQIYVITQAPSGAATQVVQKVTNEGDLNFNTQTENTTSTAQILTVTNVGNANMVLTSYSFTGAHPTNFSIDPTTTSCLLTAGATLAPGATCQIGVLFKPTTTGVLSAYLNLINNTVNNSNQVLLAGTGTAPAPSFVPGKLSFPATMPTKANSIPVTLTNTGNAALEVSKIAVGGTNADAFSVGGNCAGGSIAPNASCTLNVTFNPATTGDYAAALQFTDNAPNSPQSVFVSGSGVKPFTSGIKLASAINPAPACSAVTFQVKVSTSDGSMATGPVSLEVGGLTLASGTLTKGAATLTVQGLAPGLNLLTATYAGDPAHAGSLSSTLSQMVNRGSCGSLKAPQPIHEAPVVERP
jgi:sugar lactone lactonase YvrE